MEPIVIGSVLNVRVRLTKEILERVKEKHGEVESLELGQIKSSLTRADFVSVYKDDPRVFLYHRLLPDTAYGPKMCVTVVKHLNGDGFIITIYLSSKIRRGRIVWTRK